MLPQVNRSLRDARNSRMSDALARIGTVGHPP